ncbi:MAG: hypothetical protein KAY24_17525 [Candidatus Eisenbacteria sp.]|nr:hypothetical protein [Candidatus Eisenbacteria bacterium]
METMLDMAATGCSGPVPYISDSSVELILDTIREFEADFIVEYGSGASTQYFLQQFVNSGRKLSFISLETSGKWFHTNTESITKNLAAHHLTELSCTTTPWSLDKIKAYLQGKSQPVIDIPPDLRRLPLAKRKLWGSPLRRLRYRFLKAARPFDGQFTVLIDDTVRFIYEQRAEFVKDQFGESPFRDNYIEAGLGHMRRALAHDDEEVKAIFMIDGGPRGDVVNAILDLEEAELRFRPAIFLFEAQRVFYEKATHRRPSGRYIPGTNRMLNGQAVYHTSRNTDSRATIFWYGKETVTAEEMSEREMWFYARPAASPPVVPAG